MDMNSFTARFAPGWPGTTPRWNSSAKSGVGVSLSPLSQVWFTTSHGILNEVYYPRVDYACIRDMGLLVSDGKDFFSEEKRHTVHTLRFLGEGIPAYHFVNECREKRYRIDKEIITDPMRDALLQRIVFTPEKGSFEDYHLYALMAPHIMNEGAGNTGWCGDYKGTPMLFAHRNGAAVAMACSVPFRAGSVGFVGFSDAWQDISRNKKMTWRYERAENGNIALCGEIDLATTQGDPFLIAIGFGMNADEAGQRALASMTDGYDKARSAYIQGWADWQQTIQDSSSPSNRMFFRTSAAVVKTHEARQFPGGFIASLSVPWGFAKGDDDLGGYHLIWPRDLVETAGGLLAAGAGQETLAVLRYLRVTQEPDGHWLQNMWLDGSPYWSGIQLDETAFPVLLVNMLLQHKVLTARELPDYIPMVRKAVGYLLTQGPCSQQDRWEENPGYSPFTLSVEIAALLTAADMMALTGDKKTAAYLRETADTWNENVEAWTYVQDTALSRQLGIKGYYVRIAPPNVGETPTLDDDLILIKNLPYVANVVSAKIISPDALALVRFGLRAPDDPRILDTIKAVDALLKVDTPNGTCWHRYNQDGYGEHADGSPFDGTGIGRAWPLLTGERAHYALAAGQLEEARKLCRDMENFASPGGMIPEQIWDMPDIEEKELFFGRAAGSAMPLVWAHSEYLKLCRSLRDGEVFDRPPQTYKRYVLQQKKARHNCWRFNRKLRAISRKRILRIEALAPFRLHWSTDGWAGVQDTESRDTGTGVHIVDVQTRDLRPGSRVDFTFFWPDSKNWEGRDFAVQVE